MQIKGFHKLEGQSHTEIDGYNNTYYAYVLFARMMYTVGNFYYKLAIRIENKTTGIIHDYTIRIYTNERRPDVRVEIDDPDGIERVIRLQYNELHNMSNFLGIITRHAIIGKFFTP